MRQRSMFSDTASGESLANAITTLSQRAQIELDETHATALLGLGSIITADPPSCLRSWPKAGRDAALLSTAELIGIQLRELHPPSASRGLNRSAEFDQHFRDSYIPLMRRALESDQSLLAWCGWPAPYRNEWGLITHAKDGQFSGQIFSASDEQASKEFTLENAAYQVYVVERIDPLVFPTRTPAQCYEHVAEITRRFWDGTLLADRQVLSGQRAYELLMETLFDEKICPQCEMRGTRCLAEVIQNLTQARSIQRAWLTTIGEQLTPPHSLTAHRWAQTCEAVVARLQPYQDAAKLDEMITLATGRQEVAGAIELAAGMENALIETLI